MTDMYDDDGRSEDEIDLPAAIEEARTLRRSDELEESQKQLLALMNEYPDHPLVLFEVGGSYDVMGDVDNALSFYRLAIGAGLEGSDLQECLICIGSILRTQGEYDNAVEILEQAVDEFPDRNSGRVFLALAHYSNGDAASAVTTLLSLLLKTTSDEDILAYADTLDYYVENLDESLDE